MEILLPSLLSHTKNQTKTQTLLEGDILIHDIQTELTRNFWLLRFANAKLETQYVHLPTRFSDSFLNLFLLMSCIFYLVIAIGLFIIWPKLSLLADFHILVSGFAVFLTVMVVVAILLKLTSYEPHQQTISMIGSVACMLIAFNIPYWLPTPWIADYLKDISVFVALYIAIFNRKRGIYIVWSFSCVLFVNVMVMLHFKPSGSVHELIVSNVMMVIFSGVVALYLDNMARHRFLSELITEMQQISLQDKNDKLSKLVHIDHLSGLNNRRSFERVLADEWIRSSRHHRTLSLIMIDIDYFKAYNDHYGHIQGDEAIRIVSELIKECVSRSLDCTARYGGEEFAIILPYTAQSQALSLARTLCQGLKERQLEHTKSPFGYLTVSAGVASTIGDNNADHYTHFLHQADLALYDAKKNGRNQVRRFIDLDIPSLTEDLSTTREMNALKLKIPPL